MKAQLVADQRSGQIICVQCGQGRTHDLALLGKSSVRAHPKTRILADTGYQGLHKRHRNTELPKKKSKHKPLTADDKKANRELGSRRVIVENVIASVKRFRILAERYRNRRKRFALRWNLIAAIHNFELKT